MGQQQRCLHCQLVQHRVLRGRQFHRLLRNRHPSAFVVDAQLSQRVDSRLLAGQGFKLLPLGRCNGRCRLGLAGTSPVQHHPGPSATHSRGLNSKLHMAVDSHGMPVRLTVTGGTAADSSQALSLIEGIEAECLLADKAYDTNEIIGTARELGMDPVIPPKSNRKEQRGIRPGAVQVAALGGERISGVQAVARRGDPLCQESGVIPGHPPTTGSDDLEQTLLTTPLQP